VSGGEGARDLRTGRMGPSELAGERVFSFAGSRKRGSYAEREWKRADGRAGGRVIEGRQGSEGACQRENGSGRAGGRACVSISGAIERACERASERVYE